MSHQESDESDSESVQVMETRQSHAAELEEETAAAVVYNSPYMKAKQTHLLLLDVLYIGRKTIAT